MRAFRRSCCIEDPASFHNHVPYQLQTSFSACYPHSIVLKGLAYPVNGIIMGGLDWKFTMLVRDQIVSVPFAFDTMQPVPQLTFPLMLLRLSRQCGWQI